jgi:hypothetical protein
MHEREIKKIEEGESFNSYIYIYIYIDLVSKQYSLLLVSIVHSPKFFHQIGEIIGESF